MEYIICALIGYLIGGINPAYLLSRKRGLNMREAGSGNLGTSNTLLTMGIKPAIAVGLIDIFKPIVAILICKFLCPTFAYYKVITGVCAIMGHMYPFYLKFKGGKGFACLIGFTLAYHPSFFFILLIMSLGMAAITNYLIVATCTFSFSVPFFVIFHSNYDPVSIVLVFIPCMIIFKKHVKNIKNIIEFSEPKFLAAFVKKGINKIEKEKEKENSIKENSITKNTVIIENVENNEMNNIEENHVVDTLEDNSNNEQIEILENNENLNTKSIDNNNE